MVIIDFLHSDFWQVQVMEVFILGVYEVGKKYVP